MQATLSLRTMNELSRQPDRASDAEQASSRNAAATMSSSELLKGQKAIGIMHNGSLYRLQETKLGKLILTK
jgi:hemin uptake protein HemP